LQQGNWNNAASGGRRYKALVDGVASDDLLKQLVKPKIRRKAAATLEEDTRNRALILAGDDQ
jgi:hypothetical protein